MRQKPCDTSIEKPSADGVIVLHEAKVARKAERTLVVECDGILVQAKKAVGCLIQPDVGDKVLISRGKRCWILAVLSRDADNTAYELSVDRSLHITSQDTIKLDSKKDMAFECTGNQSFLSQKIQVNTDRAELNCQRGQILANSLRLVAKKVSNWVERLDETIEEVFQKFGNSVRKVEKHDENQVKSHRLLVEDTTVLEAEYISQRARKHVVIDGEKIHLS